jgi:hypothetical protein
MRDLIWNSSCELFIRADLSESRRNFSMSHVHRRSDRRTDKSTVRNIEALESRALLTTLPPSPFKFYTPYDIPVQTKYHGGSVQSPYVAAQASQRALNGLDNSGRIVRGQDRNGNSYVITVHGPGSVIVSDVTPNDGVLMDDIDTIQIMGSNVNRTYVSAQVSSSSRVVTDGMVRFQHLISQNGVNSIILNGFTLAQTLPTDKSGTPPEAGEPSIYLPGGVRTLQIADIEKFTDIASTAPADPFEIVIGDAAAPLNFAPIVRVGTIYNTDFDSSTIGVPAIPSTTPEIQFMIYGPTKALTTNAITRDTPVAGESTLFPPIGSQGLTSISTTAIGQFQSIGSVKFTRIAKTNSLNTMTVSPQTSLSHAGLIHIGGTADALSVSVNGPIRSLRLMKGLGNPNGTSTAATTFGTPPAATGFPAAWGTPPTTNGFPTTGLMGGQINAGSIHRLAMGAANTVMMTSNSPQNVQTTNGSTNYLPKAGNAMTSAAITTTGNIGTPANRTGRIHQFNRSIHSNKSGVTINGDLQQSELAAGFDYNQYVSGVSPITGPSVIRGLKMKGSLVDSVISASYAPNTANNNFNASGSNQVDPGIVKGSIKAPGLAYLDGRGTALGRIGAGVFARRRAGTLPPANPAINNASGVNVLGS